jgi:hypothetical protein
MKKNALKLKDIDASFESNFFLSIILSLHTNNTKLDSNLHRDLYWNFVRSLEQSLGRNLVFNINESLKEKRGQQ